MTEAEVIKDIRVRLELLTGNKLKYIRSDDGMYRIFHTETGQAVTTDRAGNVINFYNGGVKIKPYGINRYIVYIEKGKYLNILNIGMEYTDRNIVTYSTLDNSCLYLQDDLGCFLKKCTGDCATSEVFEEVTTVCEADIVKFFIVRIKDKMLYRVLDLDFKFRTREFTKIEETTRGDVVKCFEVIDGITHCRHINWQDKK